MPIGYLGYLTVGDIAHGGPYTLLCNSTGLNRQINPLMSHAVWGAGWYHAAAVTNYADNQMHFEGGMNFELQGLKGIWNLCRDWFIVNRAISQSCSISPNGYVVYYYDYNPADFRSGVWISQANISINATALITVSATGIALERDEDQAAAPGAYPGPVNSINFSRVSRNAPISPMNPAPRNTNPLPGYYTSATITWPGSPPNWSTFNQNGLVLMQADMRLNNNTQVIHGCTGDPAPVAVIQGTISIDGSINLWQNGGIFDPYDIPGVFGADGASIVLDVGGETLSRNFRIPNVLLTSDEYNVTGQNDPVTRNFGYAGIGDGVNPPFNMDLAVI